MPFRSGTVSYARFHVDGGPRRVEHELLDRLAENVITPPPVGAPPEVQAGWSAGRHLLDTDFDPEVVVFGETMVFGLRLDTNRVPPELRRAYRAMSEAGGKGADHERRAAREDVEERCHRELAAGRHRRSKLVPVLWNLGTRTLLAPVFSDTASSALCDLFEDTFGGTLEPRSSGGLAREILSARGLTRDYEDASPSPFTAPPPAAHGEEGRDVAIPAVPWSSGGPEPKDFLGNEFLLWLWGRSEMEGGVFDTGTGEAALTLDRALDLECAWDVTGKMTLRAGGPCRLPEAAKALQTGKWPRKAGMILAAEGEQWELTFQADRFLVSGGKIPRPDEPAASDREATEIRVASIIALDRALTGLFGAFVKERIDAGWIGRRQRFAEWIRSRGARAAVPKVDLEADAMGSTGITGAADIAGVVGSVGV